MSIYSPRIISSLKFNNSKLKTGFCNEYNPNIGAGDGLGVFDGQISH
jgi:hypothetical protein